MERATPLSSPLPLAVPTAAIDPPHGRRLAPRKYVFCLHLVPSPLAQRATSPHAHRQGTRWHCSPPPPIMIMKNTTGPTSYSLVPYGLTN
eukprot:scaffold44691_cov32-Tisochrysis_lutea.AAC.2